MVATKNGPKNVTKSQSSFKDTQYRWLGGNILAKKKKKRVGSENERYSLATGVTSWTRHRSNRLRKLLLRIPTFRPRRTDQTTEDRNTENCDASMVVQFALLLSSGHIFYLSCCYFVSYSPSISSPSVTGYSLSLPRSPSVCFSNNGWIFFFFFFSFSRSLFRDPYSIIYICRHVSISDI